MKIALGADHGGVSLKILIHKYLEEQGHFVINVGTNGDAACDYPDFARKVAESVSKREADRGIMVCGSGVGAVVATNKVPGVRAGLCHDTFSAHQGVEDDDMNVLCLGARIIGINLALEVLASFLNAKFSEAERHVRRKQKVIDIEAHYSR